jgi:inosine-uridine nucleoside N-ribohydrolase
VALPVILDCDTGTDDALAIALAVLHPDLDLLGVTTVWGNHEVRHTTDNSLRVLDHLDRGDVPVHAGLAGPFVPRVSPLPAGRADLPTTLDLPAPRSPAAPGPAVDWLLETLRATTAPVAVVATGPFSNLAALLVADPSVAAAIGPLVLLGGTHRHPGVTRWAERNVWCDPAAAAVVLSAGVEDVVMIGMDATFAAALDEHDARGFAALGSRAGDLAARLLTERIAWYRRDLDLAARRAAPLHDPLAVAYLVEPAVVTLMSTRCEVETRDPVRVGQTAFDLDPGEHALRVALDADRAEFARLLTSTYVRG